MNNKPGVAPLCSSTKSGKLIDRLIAKLQTDIDLFDSDFIKSNLFNIEHWPKTDSFNYEWCERVAYNTDDVIVTLGASVQYKFKKSPYNFVYIGHPSAVWSKVAQEKYLSDSVEKIWRHIVKYHTNPLI